jgi:dephospho-CoA kinase
VLAAIAHEFGTDVLEVDGGLNRARLGGIVFGNPEQLEKLNAIMHPAVKLRSADLLAAAATNNPDGVVVYDVPLLVESDIARNYDEIVVASAPEETRVRRMMEFRGLTDAEARARISAQAPEAKRLAIADVVIDTGGDLQHTLDQVDALWGRLQHSNVSQQG